MRFVLYTHSLSSDWNHGNAHFQRGILRELASRGHQVLALEPEDGWSLSNLVREQGPAAAERLATEYPELEVARYGAEFEHEAVLASADVVLVHEWTAPSLVERIGRLRRRGAPFRLLFHDTHHRAVSAQQDIADLMLQDYDAILAFGETLRERYLKAGWGRRVYTWHEAADTSRFRPPGQAPAAVGDLIWIGNWGDDERAREMVTYLVEPSKRLGLEGSVHGVRYPERALHALHEAGLVYRGWVANYDVPDRFAHHRVTVHIPRRPYVDSLPGIPTIRVFEALACGIPLVCAPWHDSEGLFRTGEDFLMARDGQHMEAQLRTVLCDQEAAQNLARSGWETIQARHTCAHRVDELLAVLARLDDTRAAQLEAQPSAEARGRNERGLPNSAQEELHLTTTPKEAYR
jgi:spore maturation protein CgeB